MVFVSYFLVIVSTAWACTWGLAFFAAVKASEDASADATDDSYDPYGDNTSSVSSSYGALIFFLCISFYWGGEVTKNVSHVTTAGTVASWW